MRVFTCIYKRSDLNIAFFWHLDYLRRVTGLDLPISVCYSIDEDYEAIKEFLREQDQAVKFSNTFLGDKWNYLTSNMVNLTNESHFIQVGSDDFMSAEYVTYLHNNPKDFAGVNRLYFYDSLSNKAIDFTYKHPVCKGIGAGRIFSREVLERAFNRANLWDSKRQSGLDNNSEKKLRAFGYPFEVLEFEEPQIVDVKGITNIHSYNEFSNLGDKVDVDKVLSLMPEITFE